MIRFPVNRAADICLVLVALTAVLVLVTSSSRNGAAGDPRAWIGDLQTRASESQIPDGAPVVAHELARGVAASVHMVQVRTAVRPHLHRSHDETVSVVSGRGTMRLGDRTLEVGPGTCMFIPRGTIHAVVNADSLEPIVALSSFAPAFDGKDRIFVEDE